MAVGVTPRLIAALVVQEGGLHLFIGLVIGIAASFGAGRVLSGLLFGGQAADALTYLSTLSILALVGLCSLWPPAYRAARMDPVTVLPE